MRILTFGWDFPPNKNGGLGVACHGLTKELKQAGCEIIFVLPRRQKVVGPHKFIFADTEPSNLKIHIVNSPLVPYQSSKSHIEFFESNGKKVKFTRTILEEVYRYAKAASDIARKESFDLIHAHDWTSYLAGLAAKKISGKPLILHVHITAFDQAGSSNIDPEIYKIEKHAFENADTIIAVSNFTRNIIINNYGIDPRKVESIHNGIQDIERIQLPPVLSELKSQGKKIVLYHGRITIQKGVDYFIRAARRVVDIDSDVMFVISGWGDMEREIMHLVGSLGLSKNVIFAGALWEEERDRMYQSADLLVMPSVSEPFGIVPLEAIQNGTPVLISKQSGVSEVLKHALKVDFWDVEEMANKILAALIYKPMNHQLVEKSQNELHHLTWKCAAEKVMFLYRRLLAWILNQRKIDTC